MISGDLSNVIVLALLSLLTIVVIAVRYASKELKRIDDRTARARELLKRLDESQAQEKSKEVYIYSEEMPEPSYGRLINDGKSVLTNDGEIIQIIK